MEFDNRVELLHSISMSLCKCEELRKTRTTSIKKRKKGGKNCRKSLGMTSSRETSLYI
jgi:hypothetical protein